MNWLKAIRICSEMTQDKIAHQVNISRAFYTNIENGKRRPSPEIAQKLACVLNFEKYGRHWSDLLIKNLDTA